MEFDSGFLEDAAPPLLTFRGTEDPYWSKKKKKKKIRWDNEKLIYYKLKEKKKNLQAHINNHPKAFRFILCMALTHMKEKETEIITQAADKFKRRNVTVKVNA